jgi:L-galactose dehydrogenase
MQTRALGKTGLQLSQLGFGASPLGGVFHGFDENEGIATVHAAIDAGINYFDVAPYYGITKAETVLGRALRTVPRERFILSTKVGRYGADDFDFSAARVIRSVDESLQRLNLETIDIIICHDIEFVSLDQIVTEALPTLETLRQRGKVRFIGISGLPLKSLIWVAERAPLDIVLSYCHYNLLDITLADWLPFFQERQIGLISASPLSMGLLADAEPPVWHPAPAAMRQAVDRAKAYCREQCLDLARIALQYALANPAIATTLVGMQSRQQLQRNLDSMDALPDERHVQALIALLGDTRNLSWPSGRPENS